MNRTVPLGVLDQVRIASPCPMKWDQMSPVAGGPGDRVRHCGQCNLNVYNLSNMSRDEAEALIAAREPGKRLCAGFRRRADGTIITRDCPVGLRAARLRLARIATRVAAAAALLVTGGVFARSRSADAGWNQGLASSRPFAYLGAWIRGEPSAAPPAQFIAGEICVPIQTGGNGGSR